jgi:hypothetical protein
MSGTEKQLADHAAQTLQRAQYLRADVALRDVKELRDYVGSGSNVENERAAAWIAISALCKVLQETPRGPEVKVAWERAIGKTQAWLEAMG